jgi:hypothetical protein
MKTVLEAEHYIVASRFVTRIEWHSSACCYVIYIQVIDIYVTGPTQTEFSEPNTIESRTQDTQGILYGIMQPMYPTSC